MKVGIFVSIFIQLCTIIMVQSCQFQLIKNKGKKFESTSQDKTHIKTRYTRKIYPNTIYSEQHVKCACGKVNNEHDEIQKSWDVFVYIRETNNDKFIRSCMGVVIAHNLVLTSHKCLMLKGKKMRPYETWRPTPKHMEENMASAENIMIGTISTVNVFAKNVTYNPEFSVYAAINDVASGDDIAIIVVKDDLFEVFQDTDDNGTYKYHRFLPVCLPERDENINLSEDILHRYAFLYGLGGKYAANAEKLYMRFATELVIFDGKECDEESNFDDFSTSGSLCIRTLVPLPTLHGYPLLTNTYDGKELAQPRADQTAFLAGLATVTQMQPPGKRMRYAYFGNVFKHLDTIEKVAKEHNSLWCTTPPYFPKKEDRLPKLEEWPWESKKNTKFRSETLDCACGFKNSDKPGRVVGGKDAIPYEFGWMAKLLWIDGIHLDTFCGASIINDRVILTAAHCVVDSTDKTNFSIVANYAVSIGGHSYIHGKEEMVVKGKQIIPHPGFIPNEKVLIDNNIANFDLALIILKEPLKFSKATTLKNVQHNDIRPICLPKVNQKIELTNGTLITAVGWGIQNPWDDYENWTSPIVLQKLQMPVRDLKYCAQVVKDDTPDTVFCAGNFTKKLGTSQGDSGGPLLFRKPNGQYYQVGVVSYGSDVIWSDEREVEWVDFNVDVQRMISYILSMFNAWRRNLYFDLGILLAHVSKPVFVSQQNLFRLLSITQTYMEQNGAKHERMTSIPVSILFLI